ncbi:MAG: LytTR family DNA-binding domain-containing protein [Alkalimonas sp.]|nr:LytTR family DNA-binding domain-containing protein [Alkalimonas sp.]
MSYRCLIVDDEPLARANIRFLLSEQTDMAIAGEAESGLQALEAIETLQPEVLFLDINLPGLDGLEVLQQLQKPPVVVFCTAYSEFAVKAFELSAQDYLLKPFSDERFAQTLVRVREQLQQHNSVTWQQLSQLSQQLTANTPYRDRIIIRDPGRVKIIQVADISWVSSSGNYVEFHLHNDDRSYLLRETMTRLEHQLDPEIFARVHRCTIVRKSDITELRPGDKGDATLVLKNGQLLQMSRNYRGVMQELL